MAYSKSQRKATEKWEAKSYDQIKFTALKGFNDRLKQAAEFAGKSKRQFIIETLEKELDGKKGI